MMHFLLDGPASVGNGGKEDNLVKSYAAVVAKPVDSTSFKIPMGFPVDVNGELGFIFLEAKMTKAADEYKFTIIMKFMRTRLSINNIRLHVAKKWGLLKKPIISFMDDFHILI